MRCGVPKHDGYILQIPEETWEHAWVVRCTWKVVASLPLSRLTTSPTSPPQNHLQLSSELVLIRPAPVQTEPPHPCPVAQPLPEKEYVQS